MIVVETYVSSSKINGLGLFANQHIKRHEIVAKWNDQFDRVFERDIFDSLPTITQQYIIKHGAIKSDGRYKLGMDGDQYINHSDIPNLTSCEKSGGLIARDIISPHDELTCNYIDVDATGVI